MTSICPESPPNTRPSIFAGMDRLEMQRPTLVPQHCRLAFLDLRELDPLLNQPDSLESLSRLLSPAELELFQRFRYPKRQLEWLGGRLAAKQCVSRLLGGQPVEPSGFPDLSILPDPHGRPRLALPPPGNPVLSLSISHSKGFAAALACRTIDCGIDIQQATPQLIKVRERFTSEEELGLIDPHIPLLTRLAMLWTAKEAIKKCHMADHPAFFGTIQVAAVRPEPEEAVWAAVCRLPDPAYPEVSARIADLDGHVIACATGEPHA